MSKVKIKNRLSVALPAALGEIRRLLDELESGSVLISDNNGEVEIRPEDEVELKVEAGEESGRGKLEFKLLWGKKVKNHSEKKHHRDRERHAKA